MARKSKAEKRVRRYSRDGLKQSRLNQFEEDDQWLDFEEEDE